MGGTLVDSSDVGRSFLRGLAVALGMFMAQQTLAGDAIETAAAGAASLDQAAEARAERAFLRRHLRALAFDAYRAGQRLPADWVLPRHAALTQLAEMARKGPTVTWIGHSTFLIHLEGRWILTDPIFSSHASPLPPLGPRRMAPPGLRLGDLPRIDVVLISHIHYDHFDYPTLSRLAARDKRTLVLTPPGGKALLRRAGFQRIVEMESAQALRVGPLAIRSLQVGHKAGRGPPHKHNDPTSAWLIAADGLRLFFSGDTGYSPIFRQFRNRFRPVDVALVPIGAYRPQRFLAHQHVKPEDSIRIARDLGARLAIGMHWGTFALTPEPILEPPQRFLAPATPGLRRAVLRIGETMMLR